MSYPKKTPARNTIEGIAIHHAVFEPARVVACLKACNGIDDPSVVPEMLDILKLVATGGIGFDDKSMNRIWRVIDRAEGLK
jgi:hypothetical protein